MALLQDIHDIRDLQQEDEAVGPVLEAAKKPSPDNIAGKGPVIGYRLQLWDQIIVREGVLYQEYEEKSGSASHLQLVVPRQMRQEIAQVMHGGVLGGHLGEKKTLSWLKERFYWPGQSEDVKKWFQNCPSCAGCQFESSVMQEVCRILQIHKTHTTPYHPQSDELVERFKQTLINMLATTVGDHPREWECHLSKLWMAYKEGRWRHV